MNWDLPNLKDLEHYFWRCTACGTCKLAYIYPPKARAICPAGIEFGFEGNFSSKGKAAFARGITSGDLEFDEALLDDIYKCTVCGGCQNQCQVDYKPHIPEVIEAMRREAIERGAAPLALHDGLLKSMRNYDNPYQGPRRMRTEWIRPFKKAGKPIKDLNKESAPILYYAGCTGAFNVNARAVPSATAEIFQKLGLDFGVLGEKEVCCGSTSLRIGDVDAFKRVAEQNLQLFKWLHDERGVNTIITSCAGCYRSFVKDYPKAAEYEKMLEGIEIIHTTAYLHRLYKQGQIKFDKELPWNVTYHDPCHTGRHLIHYVVDTDGSQLWEGAFVEADESNCLYEQPRELLQAIPGVDFREMDRNRSNAFCCGAGGGVMTRYGDWAAKNAGYRIKEAEETGAEKIVSICPFCYFNLNEGIRRTASQLEMKDMAELVNMVLTDKKR